MNELLTDLNLRRLPRGPIGFVPIVALGTSLDQNLRPIPFRLLILNDPDNTLNEKKGVIEVLETREEAQMLLETFFSHLLIPEYAAVAMIRPFLLHEFFEALLHCPVVIPRQQSASVKQIFERVKVLPPITDYKLNRWKLRDLAMKEWRKFDLLHSQVQVVSRVAAFLRSI